MAGKTVYFVQSGSMLKCQCGEFEVDMLVITEFKKQELLDHAHTHEGTSISIVQEI